MTKLSLAGSTAIALIMLTCGANAQVTPEDVWKSWQDMSTSMGQTMTATSEARDGDTLVVEGVASSIKTPDGLAADVAMGTIKFRDTGAGTVEVTMPDSYPMTMTLPPTDPADPKGASTLKILVSQPGIKLTAGGSPTETSYDFVAPTMDVVVSDIVNATGPQDVKIEAALTNVTGKYLMAGDADSKQLDSSLTAAAAVISGVGSDGETKFNVTFSTSDLAFWVPS
jgi:hypothetical protein